MTSFVKRAPVVHQQIAAPHTELVKILAHCLASRMLYLLPNQVVSLLRSPVQRKNSWRQIINIMLLRESWGLGKVENDSLTFFSIFLNVVEEHWKKMSSDMHGLLSLVSERWRKVSKVLRFHFQATWFLFFCSPMYPFLCTLHLNVSKAVSISYHFPDFAASQFILTRMCNIINLFQSLSDSFFHNTM